MTRSTTRSKETTKLGNAEITLIRTSHDDTLAILNLNDFGLEAFFNALLLAKNSNTLTGSDIGELAETVAEYMKENRINGAGTSPTEDL